MMDNLSTDLLGRPQSMPDASSLAAVLASGHAGAIAAIARVAAERGEAEALLLSAIAELILRDESGLNGTLVAAVACLRVLPEHEGVRGALPVARGLDLIAAAIAGQPKRAAAPTAAAAGGTAATLQDTLSAPLAAAHATTAEQAVRAAALGGVPTATIATLLVDSLYLHAASCAHLAPVVVAGLAFVRLAEHDLAIDTLARLARTLYLRALPVAPDHEALIAPILGAVERIHAAQDDEKAGAFQEARFRPHLLGAKPASLVRAVAKALAFGVPRARVATSLCLAGAERVLRFDPSHARSVRRRESWLDMGWLLQITEAVRTLGVLHDRPGWIGLLLHTTLLVRGAQSLDAATPRDVPEPETLARTWDHGPEIARVTGAMLNGDGVRAMAVLRGYLLMVLPEQPLSAGIAAAALEDRAASAVEQGALVATVVAALASFGAAAALPHRDLLPCAALQIFTSTQPQRPGFALAHAEVDRAEGATVTFAASPLPWLS